MTATQTLKHYGETAVKLYKTQLLATVGAGDLAVERTRTVVGQLRSRAVALPGEAQVQVDLAAKEARNRAEEAAGRARGAVQSARTSAEHLASAVRPESVKATVTELVGTARTQAIATIESLAERGAEVIEDLRRQPAFRRVVFRAERAVDTVEGAVDGALEKTGEAVAEASDEVTSVAQKTAAKAGKAIDQAEDATHAAAESAKDTLAEAEAAKPPPRPVKKSSAARASTPARTSARVTRARTAERTDPTAVPAKND
jgi:heparin binding hemagglutinin HbhA